jgi:hypothetical protein
MPGLKRRGLETERQTGVTVTGVAQPTGKPAEHEGPRTYHTGEATAPVSDPTEILDCILRRQQGGHYLSSCDDLLPAGAGHLGRILVHRIDAHLQFLELRHDQIELCVLGISRIALLCSDCNTCELP